MCLYSHHARGAEYSRVQTACFSQHQHVLEHKTNTQLNFTRKTKTFFFKQNEINLPPFSSLLLLLWQSPGQFCRSADSNRPMQWHLGWREPGLLHSVHVRLKVKKLFSFIKITWAVFVMTSTVDWHCWKELSDLKDIWHKPEAPGEEHPEDRSHERRHGETGLKSCTGEVSVCTHVQLSKH